MYVRLFLNGTACKGNCSYCFVAQCRRKGLEATPDTGLNKDKLREELGKLDKIEGISIWGGEPLEDFERYQEAFFFLAELAPTASRTVITGGMPLSDDKIISFLNKHNIQVNLSHDMHGQAAAGRYDILKDRAYLRNLGKLPAIHFNTVLHRYTVDLEKAVRQMIELPLSCRKSWNYLPFHAMDEEGATWLPQGEEYAVMKKSLDFVYRQAYARADYFWQPWLRYELFKRMLAGEAAYNCDTHHRQFFTSAGKKVLCHMHGEAQQLKIEYERGRLPAMCESCDVKSICAGGCPIMSDEVRKLNCEYNRVMYSQILETIQGLGGRMQLSQ